MDPLGPNLTCAERLAQESTQQCIDETLSKYALQSVTQQLLEQIYDGLTAPVNAEICPAVAGVESPHFLHLMSFKMSS